MATPVEQIIEAVRTLPEEDVKGYLTQQLLGAMEYGWDAQRGFHGPLQSEQARYGAFLNMERD